MTLDIQTLLVLMMANVFVVSIALPAIMGWRVSTAARYVITSGVAQGLGWLALDLRPAADLHALADQAGRGQGGGRLPGRLRPARRCLKSRGYCGSESAARTRSSLGDMP